MKPDKDVVTIPGWIGMQLVGIPDTVTGGVILRIGDAEDNDELDVMTIGIDRKGAAKLADWLEIVTKESEGKDAIPIPRQA